MFIKKFVERKPIRKAIKKMLGAGTWTEKGEYTKMTKAFQDATDATMGNNDYWYLMEFNGDYDPFHDWPSIPEEEYEKTRIWHYYKDGNVSDLPVGITYDNSVQISYSTYLDLTTGGKSTKIFLLNWIDTNNTQSCTLGCEVENTMEVLQAFKQMAGFDIKDIRCIFKRAYYDKIEQLNKQIRATAGIPENRALFLKDDIAWINTSLGLGNAITFSWKEISLCHYPRWYTTLLNDQKEYFPSEISNATMTIESILETIGSVLNKDTMDHLIYLSEQYPSNSSERYKFENEYNLVSKKIECLLRCVSVDHKAQFWYRPLTEGLECTSTQAFWCDPDAILVKYSSGSSDGTVPYKEFFNLIKNGRIFQSLSSFKIEYIDFPKGVLIFAYYSGNTPKGERLLDYLIRFVDNVNEFITRTDNQQDKKCIMNLTKEQLDELYNVLHEDKIEKEENSGNDIVFKGLLSILDYYRSQTYENPIVDTEGILIENGVLAPRWQIIYNSFEDIVTNDEFGQRVYYKNIDFETLLRQSDASEKIAEAVWAPWQMISDMTADYNYTTSIIQDRYIMLPIVDHHNSMFLV